MVDITIKVIHLFTLRYSKITIDVCMHSLLQMYMSLLFADEEMTAVQQRKFSRQQTVIADDLKDPQQFRLLLTKPGSSVGSIAVKVYLQHVIVSLYMLTFVYNYFI